MKKRLLLVLLTFFVVEINLIYAQTGTIGVRNGSYSLIAPTSITQYQNAKFIYKEPIKPTGGVVWTLPWNTLFIGSKTMPNEGNLSVCESTYVFTITGKYTIEVTGCEVDINIIPNPLVLDIPNHICPYGTQISCPTVISSDYEKVYSVKGNTTAQITQDGILTYEPGSTGTVTVKMSLCKRGFEYAKIDKIITLDPHNDYNLIGMYNINMNGSIQRRYLSPTSNNPVNNGQAVEITFQQNLYNFSWEFLSEIGAFQMSYNQNSKLFRFIPSYKVGDGFRFRFYFNENPNCTHMNYCDYGFTIRSPYSVSYIASSNLVSISREDDSTTLNRMSNQVDTYRIVDALTGVSKKQGQLVQGLNEIDATSISNGVYIVQIMSGDNTESYKISINR